MKKKIINLNSRVTNLLEKKVHLRDDDRRLICNIWWKSVSNPELLMFEDFINLYIEGTIPESDSITRCRRKIQEENKKLRGESWDKRHNLEKAVKEELKELRSIITGITI